MELKNTIDLMLSEDPVDRLKAEKLQIEIRVNNLEKFLDKYKGGVVQLPPYTDYNTLHRQYQSMLVYHGVLAERLSRIENAGTEWI